MVPALYLIHTASGECLPYARPARYFSYDFPIFNPQVHHYPLKPRTGECDDSRVGEQLRTRRPSTRGSKGTFGGTSIVGTDGDGGGDSRLGIPKGDGVHGASMVDGLHTTLMILQLQMPIVQKANPICIVKRACRARHMVIHSACLFWSITFCPSCPQTSFAMCYGVEHWG